MKFKFLGVALLSGFILAGCGTSDSTSNTASSTTTESNTMTEDSSMTSMIDTTEHLESVIVSNENNVLVVARVGQGTDMYRLEVDLDKVKMENGNEPATSELIAGLVVNITYSGIIGFSYPAFIPNYSEILVTEETDQATLDAALEAQRSMMATDSSITEE
ncbi:hypothetical protein [Enterococcus sp. HY326]|uniref:hypothetical protein n=1 Tax=Enterococcus sp. HY326 TaxID=2971265 RepID=UPI002240E20A|nr:hypothetical protein [Enterococcus sp. HY326]